MLKLSKSSQALKFGLTAGTGCKRWQTLTLGTNLPAGRARHRSNPPSPETTDGQANGKPAGRQVRVTQDRLVGGLGLDRGNWDFFGCIISPSLASLKFQRTEHQPNL
ncbi:MAG: hypothetical protein U1A23_03135 [Candidatus Sungbacteria bacterium]|nr:hypothetical protein [Candidatus Sungbacteria bacterium]